MVCLVIAGAVLSTSLRFAVGLGQRARLEHYRAQSRSLALSAIDLARRELEDDPSFTGTTWNIPAEELAGNHSARIEIEVISENDQTQLIVIATFPGEARLRTRYETTEIVSSSESSPNIESEPAP